MSKLTYVKGDLLAAIDKVDFPVWIPHVVNDIGRFGSGFAGALTKKWPSVRQDYIRWSQQKSELYEEYEKFQLGNCYISYIGDFIQIYHMCAQHQTVKENYKPIRYWALVNCMLDLQDLHKRSLNKSKILCPKFGSGLARGNWDFIEELINEIWVSNGIEVTVFTLE